MSAILEQGTSLLTGGHYIARITSHCVKAEKGIRRGCDDGRQCFLERRDCDASSSTEGSGRKESAARRPTAM